MIELKPSDKERLITFLRSNVETNIFLLAVLDRSEPGQARLAHDARFATEHAGNLTSVLYVTNCGLCVAYAPEPSFGREPAVALKASLRPRLLVGPRAETDIVWEALGAQASARLYRRHRLYWLRAEHLSIQGHPGVRLASARDLDRAAHFAACMQSEELGLDPRQVDQTRFRHRVSRLIGTSSSTSYLGDTHAFQASRALNALRGPS